MRWPRRQHGATGRVAEPKILAGGHLGLHLVGRNERCQKKIGGKKKSQRLKGAGRRRATLCVQRRAEEREKAQLFTDIVFNDYFAPLRARRTDLNGEALIVLLDWLRAASECRERRGAAGSCHPTLPRLGRGGKKRITGDQPLTFGGALRVSFLPASPVTSSWHSVLIFFSFSDVSLLSLRLSPNLRVVLQRRCWWKRGGGFSALTNRRGTLTQFFFFFGFFSQRRFPRRFQFLLRGAGAR